MLLKGNAKKLHSFRKKLHNSYVSDFLFDEAPLTFESDAYHAGMDEVFYIGDDKCPRCSGRNKAELSAGVVNAIRNHLALKNRQLWIWSDRLIDGKKPAGVKSESACFKALFTEIYSDANAK
jgi:hypothetical protein